MSRLASLFRRRQRKSAGRRSLPLRAEALEPRALLATVTVTNLPKAGAGSLRAAINQANANPGADEIAFAVVGPIPLATALPAITDTVSIDGSTAPGFVGSPRITVNFHGQAGLRFASGSYGLLAVGLCSRTRVIRNLIAGNSLGDVNIASATGITYLP